MNDGSRSARSLSFEHDFLWRYRYLGAALIAQRTRCNTLQTRGSRQLYTTLGLFSKIIAIQRSKNTSAFCVYVELSRYVFRGKTYKTICVHNVTLHTRRFAFFLPEERSARQSQNNVVARLMSWIICVTLRSRIKLRNKTIICGNYVRLLPQKHCPSFYWYCCVKWRPWY